MDFYKMNDVIRTLGLKNTLVDCYDDNKGEISLYSNELKLSVIDLLEILVILKQTYGLSKESIHDLIGNFTVNNILIQIEKENPSI